MTYSSAKDQFYGKGAAIARKSSAVVPNDTDDMDNYGVLYAITAGTVKLVPVLNADADAITMTVPAGWQSPWQVRKVFATGTSASLQTLEKFL